MSAAPTPCAVVAKFSTAGTTISLSAPFILREVLRKSVAARLSGLSRPGRPEAISK
jgi:hypothetical protein